MELKVKAKRERTELDKLIKRREKLTAGDIAGDVKKFFEGNFRKSLNIDESPMTPLKSSTVIQKRKLGAQYPSKPLVFTGQTSESTVQQDFGRNKSELTVFDNSFGSITSTQILDMGKKKNRIPWGWGEKVKDVCRKTVERIMGGKVNG